MGLDDTNVIVERLRLRLPLVAQLRPESRKALRPRLSLEQTSGACRVTHIFDGGKGRGVLCQIEIGADVAPVVIVAPIGQICFARSVPAARAMTTQLIRREGRKASRCA